MKKRTVLDVGCGYAADAIKLAEKGFKVFGIEKNRSTFQAAKKNIAKAGQEKNITLIGKDIRAVELDEEFDMIVFSYILMFMPKKEASDLIEKYYKKLKPRGTMIIRMLMSDDETVKNLPKERRARTFFPTKKELELLAEKYQAKPVFKAIHDKPHGTMEHEHDHSTGHLKIKKDGGTADKDN